MSPRALLAVVALAVCVVLALVVFRDRAPAGGGALRDAPLESATDRTPELSLTKAGAVESRAREALAPPEAANAPASSATVHHDLPDSTRPFVGALVLRVVDEDGTPVPGAVVDVHARPSGMPDRHDPEGEDVTRAHVASNRVRTAGRPPQWPEIRWEGEHGESRALSGADGIVHVARPLPEGHVSARRDHEGKVEFGTLAMTSRTMRLGVAHDIVLRPARTCRVLVLDERGAPAAGVPVAVVAPSTGKEPRIADGGSTDAAGRVVLVDRGAAWDTPPDGHDEWRVRALLASDAPIEVPLPEDGGEAVVRLPSYGAVVVVLPPALDDALVVALPPALSDALVRLSTGPTAAWQPVVAGRARFDRVALGREVTARVTPRGGDPLENTFPGPADPGEEIVHDFVDPRAAYAFRLVDEASAPFADAIAHLGWSRGSATIQGPARTDHDGRIREAPMQRRADRLEARVTSLGADGIPVVSSGAIALPPLDGDGVTIDLGPLVLVPERLLAAGRVTDRSGMPIAGAYVRVDDASLSRSRMAVTQTRGDGCFALFANLRSGDGGRLVANAPGFLESPPVPLAPGRTDHDFVLDAAAYAEVRIRLDTDARHDEIAVRVDRPLARGEWLSSSEAAVDGVRPYSSEALEPGDATIVVLPTPRGEPLAERALRLVAGERADPGLIDLASGLVTFELVVLDEDEKRIEDYQWRRIVGGDESAWSSSRRTGHVLLHPGVPAEIEVACMGRATVRAPIGDQRVVVRVPAERTALLALPAGFPMPPADTRLRLAIHRIGEGSMPPPQIIRARASADNRYEVALGAPGRFEVYVLGAPNDLPARLYVEIDVTERDLAERRTIELPFDLDTWRKAVEAR